MILMNWYTFFHILILDVRRPKPEICSTMASFRMKILPLCYSGYSHAISYHNDVIKWKHFPRYWPFVRGNHRFPANSPHKCQWRRALIFTLICARMNGWVNNREAGDLRRHRAHYDVIVMIFQNFCIHIYIHTQKFSIMWSYWYWQV